MSKQLVFKQVTIRNFMSYGNATVTVELDKVGTTLIQGRNLDNVEQGIGGNGTGKTTIINAICFALYGSPLTSDIKIDDVVNDINNKNCVVSVTVEIDGSEYVITRYRKYKDGPENNFVTIFKDGKTAPEDNLAKASMPETDKWLPTLIGMPKELFVKLVVYDADDRSFFKMDASKQRELLENLFQITVLSEKADVLKADLKQYKIDLDLMTLKAEQQETHITNHEQLIKQAEQRVQNFDVQHKSDVDALQEQLDELLKIDVDAEIEKFNTIAGIQEQVDDQRRSIDTIEHDMQLLRANRKSIEQQCESEQQRVVHEYQTKRTKIQQLIDQHQQTTKLLKSKVREVQQTIAQHQSTVAGLKKDQNQNSKQQDSIEARILSTSAKLSHYADNTCPECGQSVKAAEYKDRVAEYEQQIVTLNEEKQSVHDTLAALIPQIQQAEQMIDEISSTTLVEAERQLSQHEADGTIEQRQSEIEQLDGECKKQEQTVAAQFADQLSNINKQLDDKNQEIADKINQIKSIELTKPIPIFSKREQLDKVERTIERVTDQLNTKRVEVNPHQEALDELELSHPHRVDYAPINDKKKVIDHTSYLIKSLTDKKSFIRKRLISKRLPYLNERLKYYLQHMGLPYQVEFLSDLSPSIMKRGKSKGFGNLSHGQKARVNFALSFAFRDVLEQMHCKINLCLLDEVLDKALCEVGAMAAVHLITEKARTDQISMFVITHKKELATRFQRHLTVTLEKGFTTVDQQ